MSAGGQDCTECKRPSADHQAAVESYRSYGTHAEPSVFERAVLRYLQAVREYAVVVRDTDVTLTEALESLRAEWKRVSCADRDILLDPEGVEDMMRGEADKDSEDAD